MRTVYNGKTKSVLLDEATGDHYLQFKDSATGEDGVLIQDPIRLAAASPAKVKMGC